jgi:hypothetical protein
MSTYGRTILRVKFGSHLFGTATPASDLDLKSIFVPKPRDILLGRVKAAVAAQRPKGIGEKNVAGEVDEEAYSLQRYLGLLAAGQTVAIDLLFAPAQAFIEPPSAEWHIIVANRHRLLTRKSLAFVGYCRQQANKYGIKGARVAAARATLALLDKALAEHGSTAKLSAIGDEVEALASRMDHADIVFIDQPGDVSTPHLDICGRKLPFSASIKNGRDVVRRLVDDYGKRALQAESQQGVDWKALSHAVRVATEAIELLRTGTVTFPLPNAEHVRAIKSGLLPYADVAAEIERLLVDVEVAAATSILPADVDRDWVDDFVAHTYRAEIQRA